ERHAREDASRCAERRCLAHDIARQDDADDVADDGEKADQRVQAYGEAGTRDRDRAIEEPREPGEPLANLPSHPVAVHGCGWAAPGLERSARVPRPSRVWVSSALPQDDPQETCYGDQGR